MDYYDSYLDEVIDVFSSNTSQKDWGPESVNRLPVQLIYTSLYTQIKYTNLTFRIWKLPHKLFHITAYLLHCLKQFIIYAIFLTFYIMLDMFTEQCSPSSGFSSILQIQKFCWWAFTLCMIYSYCLFQIIYCYAFIGNTICLQVKLFRI